VGLAVAAYTLPGVIGGITLGRFLRRRSPTVLVLGLVYAGMPYQSFGERTGALALMTAWSRFAMARSGSAISAIFGSVAVVLLADFCALFIRDFLPWEY